MLLSRGYYKKESKEYIRYVGKTIILISFVPLIGGLLSLFTDGVLVICSVMILLFILSFYISINFFKKD